MVTEQITIEEVKKIALLSKINIEGDEIKFTELFRDTLKYIQILSELDTSTVSETYQVTGLTNVYQEKECSSTLSVEDSLKNASDNINNLFVTKAVFKR